MDNVTKIKVIGVGGSGNNAVSRMMTSRIKGVELVAINTDVQHLQKTRAHRKLRIGRNATKGLGTGMDSCLGREAAQEDQDLIKEILKDTDLIFITSGLGGGTGTGAAPVVAQISRELGVLTVAVVTLPFSFEGSRRMALALEGLNEIKNKVDTLIAISNDKLFSVIDPEASVDSAFWLCDEVLRQAVVGISDLIVLPGIINIDFADVKTILKNSGTALFGVGKASGEKRAQQAVSLALESPLTDISCEKAKGVLFNVSGGEDISLTEINEIAQAIKEKVSSNARIIFGAVQDEKLKKGTIKVTVVVTGF
jgi:cell division protein FtsZ